MGVARLFADQSTCLRGHVGAVIVRDNRVIATGYNGAPAGMKHCADVGCDLSAGDEAGCQRAIHAEANAIAYAARHGISTKDATLYCTAGPCLKCAQLIASSGIMAVIYEVPYRLPDGLDLIDAANIIHVQHKWEAYPYG